MDKWNWCKTFLPGPIIRRTIKWLTMLNVHLIVLFMMLDRGKLQASPYRSPQVMICISRETQPDWVCLTTAYWRCCERKDSLTDIKWRCKINETFHSTFSSLTPNNVTIASSYIENKIWKNTFYFYEPFGDWNEVVSDL